MGDALLSLGFMEFKPWLYANITTCKMLLLCFCSWSDNGTCETREKKRVM